MFIFPTLAGLIGRLLRHKVSLLVTDQASFATGHAYFVTRSQATLTMPQRKLIYKSIKPPLRYYLAHLRLLYLPQ